MITPTDLLFVWHKEEKKHPKLQLSSQLRPICDYYFYRALNFVICNIKSHLLQGNGKQLPRKYPPSTQAHTTWFIPLITPLFVPHLPSWRPGGGGDDKLALHRHRAMSRWVPCSGKGEERNVFGRRSANVSCSSTHQQLSKTATRIQQLRSC